MLQADIAMLEQRKRSLEREIDDASRHAVHDDPMIADLKSRAAFVREQIEILRGQASRWYH
jgi:hypothetical protein